MSKPKHYRTNAAQPSETVNEHQTATDEPVSDESTWEQHHESFKESILGLTKEQLLIWKNDIDMQLASIEAKAAKEWIKSFKDIPSELQQVVFEKIGAILKPQQDEEATSTSGKKSRKRNQYHGYKDIEINGVEYLAAPLINIEANDFWKSGNPDQKPWLKGLSKEERIEKFGSVEKLKENSELLEEYARIPKAVYIKRANGEYEQYAGTPADVEQSTPVEDSE